MRIYLSLNFFYDFNVMGNKNIFICAHFIKTWIVSNMGNKQEEEISKVTKNSINLYSCKHFDCKNLKKLDAVTKYIHTT